MCPKASIIGDQLCYIGNAPGGLLMIAIELRRANVDRKETWHDWSTINLRGFRCGFLLAMDLVCSGKKP
jgi:hypothetical protein